ncbi:hypothetical protein [Pseudomonas sp. AA-38]|uniref:hypothetical protein n=1 Tax=Pseudomonas sp. AA-38 TaxID=3028807 RepID=UPI0023F8F9BD|nr:hypothetical protein [Pseudomonas sp. AA-38]
MKEVGVLIFVLLLTACSGSKIVETRPLPVDKYKYLYTHENLEDVGVSVDRGALLFYAEEISYSSGDTRYIYETARASSPLIISNTTECLHESFVSGYFWGGKRNYINYVEKVAGSEFVLRDTDWLISPSRLYESTSQEQKSYIFIGAVKCRIYEISFVDTGYSLSEFKRLISGFIRTRIPSDGRPANSGRELYQ